MIGEPNTIPDDFGDEEEEDFFFNEYAIDDTLDAVSRLEKYHSSYSLHRLVLARELADTAVEAGYNDCRTRVLPLLKNFVGDFEPAVRAVFAEQLFPLVSFLIEKSDTGGYSELLTTFLPHCMELLVDRNREVSVAAADSLKLLVDLVKPNDLEEHVLNVLVGLARNEDQNVEHKEIAAQSFNELAVKFGQKLCTDVIVAELITLGRVSDSSVRKSVAYNLGNICKVIGVDETIEKLVPMFCELCKDEAWGVRKACAESIATIAQCVSSKGKCEPLFEAYEKLLQDGSRWVRTAAFQYLGHIISTLSCNEIPANFIKLFTEMARSADGDQDGDGDLSECCAFAFPAVVHTLGPDRWSELEATYLVLVKHVQWKVRKCLAHSLHELARILGTSIAENVLTQALDIFVCDLDEVRTGAVQNIPEFLAIVGEETRARYIPAICQLPDETDNWRLRSILGSKLGQIARLCSAKEIHTIARAVMRLLQDSVAEVRMAVLGSASIIIHQLAQDEVPESKEFLAYIQSLAPAEHYQVRQLFIYIAQQVAEHELKHPMAPNLFETQFLDQLSKMSTDSVANVRLGLAKIMSQTLINTEKYQSLPQVMEIKEQLAKDADRDVLYFNTHCASRAE